MEEKAKRTYKTITPVISFSILFCSPAFADTTLSDAEPWSSGEYHAAKAMIVYDDGSYSDELPGQMLAANTVVFNPRSHSWTAINSSGKVVRSGRASGGKGYCPDIHRSCRTPTGTYHVISKSGPGCRSTRYPVGSGGAPMPYCMFFSKYYAIHGSPDVPNYNASHGCIRVHPSDARWLNQNFVNIGTKVVVKPY